jgi:hypothetical protein
MIASAHVAAGAFVGAAASRLPAPMAVRVLVAMIVGAGGHLLMDAIPHSDYLFIQFRWIALIGLAEALVACGVVAMTARGKLASGQWIPLAAGVAFSMAPDVKFVARVLAPQWELPITRVTDAIHGWHATEPLHVWIAFAGEVFLAVGFFYLFTRMLRGAAARRPGPSTAPASSPSAS